MASNLTIFKDSIESYPDFPKPGVNFKDVFSVLKNPDGYKALLELVKEKARSLSGKIHTIVALDARGFLFGLIMASEIHVPFVPIRKKGKLPGECISIDYALEYGNASIEIQKNALAPGHRVLVVDDLLATGGTLLASIALVQQAGGVVEECFVLMELGFLKAREKFSDYTKITSLVVYDDE